jgi:glycosyltransferase involved in cell wall biosynthesis
MKILLSAYACRPNAGTEPGYGWNWATHLAACGMEVHVLTAARYREQIEPALAANPVRGLKFSYVGAPRIAGKCSEGLYYAMWQLSALKVAKELVRDTSFDLAHHVTYGSVHVPSQLWRLGIPLVFGPVGGGQTAPANMLNYFGKEKRRERIRTAVTRGLTISPIHRRSMQRMSYVLAANQDTLELAYGLGCKHAALMCDAGLPANFFPPAPRKFEPTERPLKLLWVGRMLPRKGLPLALDALKQARQPVELTIAGDGLEPSKVLRMIADRKLEERVSWQGRRLTWSEVRAAYLQHDAMLFTSLRDSFGSQLLEAMALGLPVITLDLHGAHDFVPKEAGLKVPLGGSPEETVQNLVNAIENYAAMPVQQRNQMSAAGWSYSHRFTWNDRAKCVGKIYEGILSKSKNFDNVFACNPDETKPLARLAETL